MIEWISENIGTIAVSLVLIGMVCAVAAKMVRDKRNHKTSCGCGCEHCAMSGTCHKSE